MCVGEQHGQLSATVLVDQPILEDDEEDEEREGEVTGGEVWWCTGVLCV